MGFALRPARPRLSLPARACILHFDQPTRRGGAPTPSRLRAGPLTGYNARLDTSTNTLRTPRCTWRLARIRWPLTPAFPAPCCTLGRARRRQPANALYIRQGRSRQREPDRYTGPKPLHSTYLPAVCKLSPLLRHVRARSTWSQRRGAGAPRRRFLEGFTACMQLMPFCSKGVIQSDTNYTAQKHHAGEPRSSRPPARGRPEGEPETCCL